MHLKLENDNLAEALRQICSLARDASGRALVVGGAVRDSLLGIPVKELDIEVYGIAPDRLKSVLAARFSLDLVGEAFGVIKVRHLPIDISLPRRESKAGRGHRGFEILSDPAMHPREAAARRDFTINAIACDPLSGEILDFFNGRKDLKARVLRHTSERFVDDPLRVLRGMQFAARFDLDVARETIDLCTSIEWESLSPERVFEEWKKLILRGKTPSRGLRFLKDCRWLRFFPDLEGLVDCRQDPDWHPEGGVWPHTLHCIDAFAGERIEDAEEDLIVGFGVLCHDFGKPATTAFERGRLRSIDHEEAGAEPTRRFLSAMTNQRDLIEDVVALVTNHLKPQQLYDGGAGDAAVRRLAVKVRRIDRLVRVARADQLGRPPIHVVDFPAGEWLLQQAGILAVRDAAPKPIVLGRHLIALGEEPGPGFGPILRRCYDAQIEGTITCLEEGLDLARRLLKSLD
jgi:tRNA nucleotidyltransferase (CCA-adding enzyme)